MAQSTSKQDNNNESNMEELFLKYEKKYLQGTCMEKLNCSFDSWYLKFRKQTIKSRIITLNETFINYLEKDGLKLPPSIESEMDNYYDLDSDNDSDYDNDPNFKDDDESKKEKEGNDDIDYCLMDELFIKIREKIDALKGEIICKLNWSLPKDSKWINGETIKCINITQILLLLKSSQFIKHDLFHSFHGCYDYDSNKNNIPKFEYKLILRKYSNLHPNREFRCFIYDSKLISIIQRNDDDFYEELQSQKSRNKLRECINQFFINYVQNKFADNKMDKYVMDIYIDKDYKVFIIDFNPFYQFTDCPSGYSWIDICKLIEDNDNKQIHFGFIDKKETAKIKFNSNSQYRYPIDAVDLTNEKHINEFVESCIQNK